MQNSLRFYGVSTLNVSGSMKTKPWMTSPTLADTTGYLTGFANRTGRRPAENSFAHLVENAQLRVDQREALEEALAGSRFVLSETDDGLELMLRISATAEKEVKDQRGYIEEHAPDAVLRRSRPPKTDSRTATRTTHCRRLVEHLRGVDCGQLQRGA